MSTTATYYIKTAADDVRNAMTKLENHIEGAESTSGGSGTCDISTRPATRLMRGILVIAGEYGPM